MPKNAPERAQWASLSLLRFLLALCVAIFHCGGGEHGFKVVNTWFGGTGAVVGFLFISGFSIAHSLAARHEGFLKRRLLRIYPIYALCLIVPCALGMLRDASSVHVLAYFFFLQGMLVPQVRPVIGVFWSLAAEWWLYVIAPRITQRTATIAALVGMPMVALYCAFFGWRAVLFGQWGVPLLGCAPFWLAGFALAGPRTPRRTAALVGVGMVACVVTFHFGDLYHLRVTSPITALSGLLAVTCLPRMSMRAVPLCEWLGDVSYPLYLVHMMALELPWPWYQVVALALVLAIGLDQLDKALKQRLRRLARGPSTEA